MKYGKCQRCEALGVVAPVGTLDGNTGIPVVLQLCSQCSKLYLHLNRTQRRQISRMKPGKAKRRPDNWILQQIRERARAPKKSSILVPQEKPVAPEIPKKSSLIIPGRDTETPKHTESGLILP